MKNVRTRFEALNRRWMIFSLLQLCLAFNVAFAFQQESRTITGTVTDTKTGETLPGVSILIKGTSSGAITDIDGVYTLEVSSGQTLIFSSIGYASREVEISNQTQLDLQLEQDISALDEVVVIGYGEVRRRDLTGSVTSVKSEDIALTPAFNVIEGIKGRAPGVDIVRSSGQAGAGFDVRVRGNRSISGGNSPLVIIDGFQGGSLNTLNPNDIESMEILKDASATAIYGSQGANGVILITTKSGQEGRTTVSYDAFFGVNGMTQFPALRTGDDYIQLRREAFRTDGLWSSPADDASIFANDGEWDAVQNNRWVDWTDLIMRDGTQQSHTVSVKGGSSKTQSFFSGGYFREEGMLRGDDMTRYNGRYNVSHKINDWAEVGVLGQLTYFNRNRRNSPLSNAVTLSPFGNPYDEEGNINLNPIPANPTFISPLADERNEFIARDNEIRTNLAFNSFLELKPIEGLKIRTNFGVNLDNSRRGIYEDADSFARRNNRQSHTSNEQNFSRFYNLDNIITYRKRFDDHSFVLTGITNYIRRDTDNLYAFGINQALPTQLFYNIGATDTDSRVIGSDLVRQNQMSYAGRIDYQYKDRYMVTLTNRWDGASQLAPGNKWASFPSVALGWVMSDEEFMRDINVVNFFKLRGSYGVAGNSAIAPYGTQALVQAGTNLNFGGIASTYYRFSTLAGNPNLGWEYTASYNFAADMELFEGRVNATVDVYQQNTTDLLMLRNQPLSTGVLQMYENIGATRNKGVEVMINTKNIMKQNFDWSSTFTFTRNREQIVDLIDGEDILQQETNSLLLGRPINSFFSFNKLGIWQENEADQAALYDFGGTPFRPGDIKIEDVNGDFTIDQDDRQFLGSNVPNFIFGLQNDFRYKAFDLRTYIFTRWGHMINSGMLGRYNPGGEGNGPAFIDYWTPENPTNDYPRPRRGASLSNYAGYQSLTFVEGSFIKLQTVSLGYTMPRTVSQKFKVQNLRLYVTGNNLWAYSKDHRLRSFDPESGGQENFPLMRQVVFGINVDF